MKKILAFILAVTFVMSSASVLASAEHTHKPGNYPDLLKTEYTHSYICKYCSEVVTEYHDIDENGECDCGYFEHEHQATTYPIYTDTSHSFTCTVCKLTINENHILDENNECVCGYIDHEHVARIYSVINIDGYHTFICKYCGATVTEKHEMDGNGICACGYGAHDHIPDVYGFVDDGHMYWCTECYSEVVELHTFDENGKCECGYVNPDQADFFVKMFQPLTIMFSLFRFFISSYTLGLKLGFGMAFGK